MIENRACRVTACDAYLAVPTMGIRRNSMTVTTTLRRAVAIALVAIFGLGTSAIPAAFAGIGGCGSSAMPAGCCCGLNGEDCGCGGSCCGDDASTPPEKQDDSGADTPAIVCLCGIGDSAPAVPSSHPVSVAALMQTSSDHVVEILDVSVRPTGLRSQRHNDAAPAHAMSVLRL